MNVTPQKIRTKTSGGDALTATIPPKTVIALNRMTFGADADLLTRVTKGGLSDYIDEQLSPGERDDVVAARIAAAQLHIKYDAKDDYPGVDEDRPLGLWDAPIDKLWPLANYKIPQDGQERHRPLEELRVVSWIRAVYSDWQLRELMTEFWHNHFNVNPAGDIKIAVSFPVYDRDVIRKNVFGNFRAFLEDVAKSTAMQFYLDNASSKASPANENYARELFELHTLGSDHYYNSLYNRWREVPGALSGKPIGYIDEDVYEAARSFTGWTIANGASTGKGENLPDTGTFIYQDGWHDNYQKRVLGVEFDPNQPPLADGKKVLDLVAFHPATAKHICQKLCRKLIADNPPPHVVNGAATVWTRHRDHPNQIRETLRYILTAKEMEQGWGQKVKTPFELVASMMRVTGADFTPRPLLSGLMNQMGYLHYHWPTPTGHPDTAVYWLSSNTMLARWNTALHLINTPPQKIASYNFTATPPTELKTVSDHVSFWSFRILQREKPPQFLERLAVLAARGKKPNEVLTAGQAEKVVPGLISALTMTPDFQLK
jgi:uncharacterized protein (DUF1800 family)